MNEGEVFMDPKFKDGWFAGYFVATILYIVITLVLHSLAAKADTCDEIECIIAQEARSQGVSVSLAIAVGKVESGLNMSARGPFGEVGIFQIRPEYTNANIYDLRGNIKEGIRQLAYWKQHCPVKDTVGWVNCYNAGYRNPKYPLLRPYVKKVIVAMRGL